MYKMKPFILLLITIIAVLSCEKNHQTQKEEKYVIAGHLTGFPDNTIIYLKNLSTDANVDSSLVVGGKFQMEGKFSNPPEQLWLTSNVQGNSIYTNLLMGNDSLFVTGDVKEFPWKIKRKGSQIQEEYNQARNLTKEFEIERDSLVNFFVALPPEEQQKRGKEIWTRIGAIDSITLAKRFQYLKSNKTFISVIDLGYLKNQLPKDTVKTIFQNYPEEIRNSKYGNVIKTYLKRDVLEVGDTFYDFEGLNQQKEKVQLSSIRNKEKFTLIDFTSTHCGASMQAADELASVYQNYSDSLKIVSFSGDPQKEAWLEGVERDSVKWLSIWDGKGRFSETSISYGVTSFPTFVLINPKGEIVDKWSGYSEGNIKTRIDKNLKSNNEEKKAAHNNI